MLPTRIVCVQVWVPQIELAPWTCTGSRLDFSPFDVDCKLVFELGEPNELIIP